jgi:hypothetical protein
MAASAVDRLGPGLVNLNGRIFALAGFTTDTHVIEEFFLSNNSWYVHYNTDYLLKSLRTFILAKNCLPFSVR